MSGLWDRLGSTEPQFATTEDATTYDIYRQETTLVQFLMALQSDFDHIQQVLQKIPLPTLDIALYKLLDKEQTQNPQQKRRVINPQTVFLSITDSSSGSATRKKRVVDPLLLISPITA